jgi:hypothetical protein
MSQPGISAKTPLPFHTYDDDIYSLNFTQFGIGSRTITTVDHVTAAPTGPVFSSLSSNAGIIDGENGQDVAIGKAATFRMVGSAATPGTDYDVTVEVTLSDGHKMAGVFVAQCREA